MKLAISHLKPLLIAAAVLLGVCCAWYFFLYDPGLSKLQVINDETEKLLVKLQSFRVTDEQLSSLEEQIRKIDNELHQVQAKVLPKGELPLVIDQIQKKGRVFGLKFSAIIPEYKSLVNAEEPESGSGDLIKLTVHAQLQGYYKNFGRFLESLAQLPFYVSLGEISLVYHEPVYPQIVILVDFVLYLRADASGHERVKT